LIVADEGRIRILPQGGLVQISVACHMKLKFNVQYYQSNAVEAVVDCFAGQPRSGGLRYRIDPGKTGQMIALD